VWQGKQAVPLGKRHLPQVPPAGSPHTETNTMLRKPATIAFWTGRLPHWEVEDGRYFVTIRLAGAIPQEGQDRIRQLAGQFARLDRIESPESWLRLQRRIFRVMEDWLHRTETVAHLRQPEIAAMVMEAIEHRQQRGDWTMWEYVVMPNHVHLFFELRRGSLKSVLEDFKRWTSHQAVRQLQLETEHFWQREWFDHWSRSDEEDERIIRYIRDNPVQAGLVARYEDWRFGSWVRAIKATVARADSDAAVR
jgi:REP element-mobilizing transposase RayT